MKRFFRCKNCGKVRISELILRSEGCDYQEMNDIEIAAWLTLELIKHLRGRKMAIAKFWSCVDCGEVIVARSNPGPIHKDGHCCIFTVDRDLEQKLRIYLRKKNEARP